MQQIYFIRIRHKIYKAEMNRFTPIFIPLLIHKITNHIRIAQDKLLDKAIS